MFDDVSSSDDDFHVNENRQDESSSSSSAAAAAAAVPSTVQVTHVDPVVSTLAAPPQAATEGEQSKGGIQFIKTVQAPAVLSMKAEREAAVPASTVASTPAPAAVPAAVPAPAVSKKAISQQVEGTGAATPASAAKRPKAAATPSANTQSSVATPATVSKRPEREEVDEADVAAVGVTSRITYDSARKPRAATAGNNAGLTYRTTEDEPVYASTSKAKQQQQQLSTRQRSLDYRENTHRRNNNSESRMNHYGDSDGEDPAVDEDETNALTLFEMFFAPYLFPRLDPDIAEWDEPERERVLQPSKLDDLRRNPPNCVEANCAYLLATDKRLTAYFVALCLVIIFTIVSIPTSQIDITSSELLREVTDNMVLNSENVYNFSNAVNVKSCYTYWGYKEDCDAAPYTLPVSLMWCTAIKSRLQAGAAFSIISLVIYLVLFLMTAVVMCCLTESPRIREKNRRKNTKSRWIIGIVGVVCVITHVICWACIAGIHSSNFCAGEHPEVHDPTVVAIHDDYKAFGVGFGLSLTAWCLHVLGVVQLLFLPGYLVHANTN